MSKLRLGLIGVGGIMNGAHIPGYLTCDDCEIVAICDINPETLKKVGEKLNIPEENRFLHHEDMMKSGLVDVVDIATPDNMHCPIATDAVKYDLPFSVEKPMGMTYKEVKKVCDAAAEKNLPGHVCFSWHYFPYIRMMREKLATGMLGKIYHIYVRCIRNSGMWEGRRLEWRFDEKQSASGVMGDLSSHMFSIANFLGHEFVSVSADAGIFVKERQALDSDEILPVTTWDWCNVLAKMDNDVNATFQISRTCEHIDNWVQIEVYGEKGRMEYVNRHGETLEVQTNKGEVIQLIPDASYKAVQSHKFINLVKNQNLDGTEATLVDAYKSQAALDAAYRSVKEGRWVTIAEVEKDV
ncbi:MAG: Gfo/Idh/MocA family oxidoreductase [Clostridiales bacterium]|nr:Gfo/Idh/MocA family oxidoreductase [Clostridiales bacterium]